MRVKLLYLITTLLIVTSCMKGMDDMMMMHCKNDSAVCRSMCSQMLDNPETMEWLKGEGINIKNPQTGELDREATLNKMMEMCVQNNKSFRQMCCKMMMNNTGMMGRNGCK